MLSTVSVHTTSLTDLTCVSENIKHHQRPFLPRAECYCNELWAEFTPDTHPHTHRQLQVASCTHLQSAVSNGSQVLHTHINIAVACGEKQAPPSGTAARGEISAVRKTRQRPVFEILCSLKKRHNVGQLQSLRTGGYQHLHTPSIHINTTSAQRERFKRRKSQECHWSCKIRYFLLLQSLFGGY